jgi:hypothetical protein
VTSRKPSARVAGETESGADPASAAALRTADERVRLAREKRAALEKARAEEQSRRDEVRRMRDERRRREAEEAERKKNEVQQQRREKPRGQDSPQARGARAGDCRAQRVRPPSPPPPQRRRRRWRRVPQCRWPRRARARPTRLCASWRQHGGRRCDGGASGAADCAGGSGGAAAADCGDGDRRGAECGVAGDADGAQGPDGALWQAVWRARQPAGDARERQGDGDDGGKCCCHRCRVESRAPRRPGVGGGVGDVGAHAAERGGAAQQAGARPDHHGGAAAAGAAGEQQQRGGDRPDATPPTNYIRSPPPVNAASPRTLAAVAASGAKVSPAPESYLMSDCSEESDSAMSPETPEKRGKKVPLWAKRDALFRALQTQNVDPDEIFQDMAPPDLEEIFGAQRARYRRRASSANWTVDGLSTSENANFKRKMGFAPISQHVAQPLQPHMFASAMQNENR